MAKTDVISAMEAIEGAALQEKPRKKTPPLSHKEEERKKALIRYIIHQRYSPFQAWNPDPDPQERKIEK